jgi:Mg2+/Co2+ transporter CorC
MLLFGELLPKRIALANPERAAAILGPAMRSLSRLLSPFSAMLGSASDAMATSMGFKPRPITETVGDEDVRALVERGLHAGVFKRAKKEMVEGVLSLDKLLITAIMTPRSKIVFLNIDDNEETNWRKIVTSGHSYFPVFQKNRDQVVGMVSVKALWAHSAIGLPTTLKNLLVPPLIAPESMTAIQLLEQFKKTGRHTAVISDEFGAVQGLVTLIDVFEAIVGDLPEPGHRNQAGAKRREDGSWLVDATLPIAEFKSVLGIGALPNEVGGRVPDGGRLRRHPVRPDPRGRGPLRVGRLALRGRRDGPAPGRQARGGGRGAAAQAAWPSRRRDVRITCRQTGLRLGRAPKCFAHGGTMQDAFTGQPTCIRGSVLPDAAAASRSSGRSPSADWKRSLDLARRQPNAISEQIRTAISSSSRKTK